MAYIYKITNDINGKIYIGKTYNSIEKRFKEHCNDRLKRKCEQRPLYFAMNKYGIEHFHIELIEETDEPNEREIYWISYFDSYYNGYNATKGGEGTKVLDYDAIKDYQLKVKNVKKTAEQFNSDREYISKILKTKGIYIQTFNSITEAGYAVWNGTSNFKGMKCHISAVCKGKRQTACGYKWKYVEE